MNIIGWLVEQIGSIDAFLATHMTTPVFATSAGTGVYYRRQATNNEEVKR